MLVNQLRSAVAFQLDDVLIKGYDLADESNTIHQENRHGRAVGQEAAEEICLDALLFFFAHSGCSMALVVMPGIAKTRVSYT